MAEVDMILRREFETTVRRNGRSNGGQHREQVAFGTLQEINLRTFTVIERTDLGGDWSRAGMPPSWPQLPPADPQIRLPPSHCGDCVPNRAARACCASCSTKARYPTPWTWPRTTMWRTICSLTLTSPCIQPLQRQSSAKHSADASGHGSSRFQPRAARRSSPNSRASWSSPPNQIDHCVHPPSALGGKSTSRPLRQNSIRIERGYFARRSPPGHAVHSRRAADLVRC